MTAAVRWLLAPSRRWWTAVTAGVVVLGVVLTVVFWPYSDDEPTERVANAIVRPDPVPNGPTVTSIPPDCGLSLRTLRELVAGVTGNETRSGPDEQSCSWDSSIYSFGDGRELEVGVQKAHELALPAGRRRTTHQEFISGIGYGRGSGSGTSVGKVRPVTGLGAEAVIWRTTTSSDEVYQTVLFWQGNVYVEVRYGGEDIAEDENTRGALRAAVEVARGLRVTVEGTPEVGTAGDRFVRSVPGPCDLVSAAVVEEFSPGASRQREESYLFEDEENAVGGGCAWNYNLRAEIEAASTSGSGTGEQVAARRYLQLYLAARSAGPDTDDEDAETYAVSLRGLGDEAYISYQRDSSSEGEVVFRVRNVLARVSVRGLYDEDLSEREALDGAYRVAVAAARNVKT